MSGYLIFSVDHPEPWSVLRPSTWFHLGHVEIVLWEPPGKPESYGFYVNPPTWRRVLLSVFAGQSARIVRGSGLLPYPSQWRCWELDAEQVRAVRDYLGDVDRGSARGSVRYHALRFNCFHLAYECLRVAGQASSPRSRQWVGCLPTRGSKSFSRDLMAGREPSVMSKVLPVLLRGAPKPELRQTASASGSRSRTIGGRAGADETHAAR